MRVTIDGIATDADPQETVLCVARRLGIAIPTMCYLEGMKPLESCGICVVEVEGRSNLLYACATRVADGMNVHTNTPRVREARKLALELLLSDHRGDCLAPCELACPAHIDIPEFIDRIAAGQHRDALAIIKEVVAFPGVLGRICPRFCELACRRGQVDEAVSICALKRFPADHDLQEAVPYLPAKQPPSGKRVAIVGAGITGLTAAYHLLREGHDCTIYDSAARPGGAMRNIIGEYRLPRPALEAEIEIVRLLGARFQMRQTLGRDLLLHDLLREHGAVLLAIGATREKQAEFPGVEHARPALDFLRAVSDGERPVTGRDVVVLGSGLAAFDTARTLLRLGAAKVTLLMDSGTSSTTFFIQKDDAVSEGVKIQTSCEPIRMEQGWDGTLRLVIRQGGKEIICEADMVFHAAQLEPDFELIWSLGLDATDRGIRVNPKTFETSVPGVFAAGSAVKAGAPAVQCSASASLAARAISRFLRGARITEPRPPEVRVQNTGRDVEELLRGVASAPRLQTRRRRPDDARAGFEEADEGFSEEQAIAEASRCLQCACAKKRNCRLQALATEYQADATRFAGVRRPFERDDTHPDIVYEPAKCIRCGRCLVIAEEAGEPLGLTYIGRGFQVKVAVPFNEPLREGLRRAAIHCADACPTGALARKRRR